MSEAIRRGISRYTLYSLLENGVLERVSRGVYRLSDLPPISNPDLVTVALRFPDAVICLVSALSYYDMTTQIPHRVSIAVPRQSRVPSLVHPPLVVHRFAQASFEAGIEVRRFDNVPVRIYSVEKTIVDSFKFLNRIGMDVVLEALRNYHERGKIDIGKVIEYARICRVENVMRPYLEAST